MAEYFVDPTAAPGGNGSQGAPYNAIPGANFGSNNLWRLKVGTVLDMGATQHAVGNTVLIKPYGDGSLRPTILSAAATALMVFSNDDVSLEDLILRRSGAVGGNGVNIGGGAAQRFRALRTRIEGFGNGVYADKAQSPLLQECDFAGNTVAVQGAARDGVDCTNWQIIRNDFSGNGTDLLLRVSENGTYTAGAFDGLDVLSNTFSNAIATAIQLNCAAYVSTGNIAVSGPSTLTRSANWPSWPVGSQIFLTNFANRANFGLFTVASVSGTTLTVVETTLVIEASSAGKQVWLWRADRMFRRLRMIRNTIRGTGATPVLLDTMLGGEIYRNTIESCIVNGVGAAGIETGNCDGLWVERNDIADMRTAVFDGMGVFLDNAVRNARVVRNRIEDCRGGANDNSGAGLAIFNCVDNILSANVVKGCKRGVWMGGAGTTGNKIDHNTIYRCAIAARINSSPLAASNSLRNNTLVECAVDFADDANQTKSGNVSGTRADLGLGEDLRPRPGSRLLAAVDRLEYPRDADGKQRPAIAAVGAFDVARVKTRPIRRPAAKAF